MANICSTLREQPAKWSSLSKFPPTVQLSEQYIILYQESRVIRVANLNTCIHIVVSGRYRMRCSRSKKQPLLQCFRHGQASVNRLFSRARLTGSKRLTYHSWDKRPTHICQYCFVGRRGGLLTAVGFSSPATGWESTQQALNLPHLGPSHSEADQQ